MEIDAVTPCVSSPAVSMNSTLSFLGYLVSGYHMLAKSVISLFVFIFACVFSLLFIVVFCRCVVSSYLVESSHLISHRVEHSSYGNYFTQHPLQPLPSPTTRRHQPFRISPLSSTATEVSLLPTAFSSGSGKLNRYRLTLPASLLSASSPL